MPKISATIICRNEEAHIQDCLESVAWCDEIIVVDSGSKDRTVEIAQKFATKVIPQHDWKGYINQVNFCLAQATGDWVLALDADERCSPELKAAIQKELPALDGVGGFEIKRHTWYMGRWINHGEFYPDWKLRFLKREGARCGGHEPHYQMIPVGPVKRLDADLYHYTYDNFKDQLKAVDEYSDLVSLEWQQRGRTFGPVKALIHSWAKFMRCYFLKLGFLDGLAGLVIAVTTSFFIFAKYIKLAERENPALTKRPK